MTVDGAGGCFSAGMDRKALAATGQRPPLPGRGFAGFTERPPAKPLIAAVTSASAAVTGSGIPMQACRSAASR
jgi:enoyl-CoA hydratase